MVQNPQVDKQSLLKRLAERGGLSHAYLFSGNDEKQKDALVADLVASLHIHAEDRIILEPVQDEITIVQIRELSSFFSMTAWNSTHKVALLRHVHTMNREAQSAFLKLLEEPKGDAIFFLLTEYPDMLFDTIRSRAQEFKFYSFVPPEVFDDTIGELQKLQKADLGTRFGYAKKLADEPERIQHLLHQWLLAIRQMLRTQLEKNPQDVPATVRAIRTIQETLLLLRTTNVSPRLALERVMLNLAAN
ncbi:MAG: hypothetical protein HYT49_01620 [Candidatus Wildermuthbacteria bacterium]|nr:hypothetical protein [Candidatus Wildermuthbacteria bacterium]